MKYDFRRISSVISTKYHHRASASPSTPTAPNADTVSPVGCAACIAAPLDEVELADPPEVEVVVAVAAVPVFAAVFGSDVVAVNAPAEICDLTTDM